MALLPPLSMPCPTLAAANSALEGQAKAEIRRTYLGMSAIGDPCSRRLWYEYHDPKSGELEQSHFYKSYEPITEDFGYQTLMRFADGHRSEDLMAERLRLVPGLQLWTVDPDTQNQFAVYDLDGKFSGHLDGIIQGLIQAPKTPHVWEGKCVNEKSFALFQKLKNTIGEKLTLQKWKPIYYAQAQCYMGYMGMSRHYLTVCTPGGRDWDAVRTDFDVTEFEKLKSKAQRIIENPYPLAKLSQSPTWFECKMCKKYYGRCHKGEN